MVLVEVTNITNSWTILQHVYICKAQYGRHGFSILHKKNKHRGVQSHPVVRYNFITKKIHQDKRLAELNPIKHLQTSSFATPITC